MYDISDETILVLSVVIPITTVFGLGIIIRYAMPHKIMNIIRVNKHFPLEYSDSDNEPEIKVFCCDCCPSIPISNKVYEYIRSINTYRPQIYDRIRPESIQIIDTLTVEKKEAMEMAMLMEV